MIGGRWVRALDAQDKKRLAEHSAWKGSSKKEQANPVVGKQATKEIAVKYNCFRPWTSRTQGSGRLSRESSFEGGPEGRRDMFRSVG